MRLDSVVNKLTLSARLVNEWGMAALPNGKTLSSMFTYDGIALWDIIAVVMALYEVPGALFLDQPRAPVLRKAKVWLRGGKYRFLNRKYFLRKEGCLCRPAHPVFLFLGFQPYLYRDTLEPIVQSMLRTQETCPVSLYDYLPIVSTGQGGAGALRQSVWEHWDGRAKAYADDLTRALRRSVRELRGMRVLPDIIGDQRVSVRPQLAALFDWIFDGYLPYLMRHVAIARHILQEHRPAVIISPDVSDPRNRLYCLLGKQLRIPTLEVQFGVYGEEAVEWRFFGADKIAAWGEASRDVLISHGVPEEKIILTGSPRHDSKVVVSSAGMVQRQSGPGIVDGRKMVLFASQLMSVYDQIEDPLLLDSVKRAIFQAADQSDGLCLVVKPHPREDVEATKRLAQGCRNVVFVDKAENIRELIAVCDAFVSLGSTATMDAIIANKLTICPKFPGWIWSEQFVHSGAVLVPVSRDELAGHFHHIKDGELERTLAALDPARQRFLQQWIFKVDGGASDRISAVLLNMAKGEQAPNYINKKAA